MDDQLNDISDADWLSVFRVTDHDRAIELSVKALQLATYRRNDLCWCGSGVKYKKCHLGKKNKKRLSIEEVVNQRKSLSFSQSCLFPIEIDLDNEIIYCKRKPILSHTIQKSVLLQRISSDNMVYGIKKVFRPNVRPKLEKVGVNIASTFRGFCNIHDTSVFAELERQNFIFSTQQIILTSYRAIAYEIDSRNYMLVHTDWLKQKADLGLSLVNQIHIQENMNLQIHALKSILADLNNLKDKFDRALIQQEYSAFKFLVIEMAGDHNISCCEVRIPVYNFTGHLVQPITLQNKVQVVAVSILPIEKNRNVFIACWLKESHFISSFIENLLNLSHELIPHALVRFIFSYFENIFLKPYWWENLPEKDKLSLQQRNQDDSPSVIDKPDLLCDDGVRAVDWKVTRIMRDDKWIMGDESDS